MRGAGPIAAGVGILLLSACNPFDRFAPTETEILQTGFIEPDRFPPPEPIFCYRTLAEEDCFTKPRPDEAGRFVGAYLPVYVIE